MNINVTKNNVTISNEQIHKGEYNINPLLFSFSEEYTDDLVKKAVFTTLYGNHYSVTIINNEATIPYEVLQKEGNVLIGVYAYQVSDDELVLRYSPKPVYVKIEKGSFVNSQDGTTVVPALTIEQYEQALNGILTNFEIDKDIIVADIVNTSKQEFNTYYKGKTGDFDNYVVQKEAQFDEHLDEYEKTWRGTLEEYEQLTKDNNTQYYIEEV